MIIESNFTIGTVVFFFDDLGDEKSGPVTRIIVELDEYNKLEARLHVSVDSKLTITSHNKCFLSSDELASSRVKDISSISAGDTVRVHGSYLLRSVKAHYEFSSEYHKIYETTYYYGRVTEVTSGCNPKIVLAEFDFGNNEKLVTPIRAEMVFCKTPALSIKRI